MPGSHAVYVVSAQHEMTFSDQSLLPKGADGLDELEWAYCNAGSRPRADALEILIKQERGAEHFYALVAGYEFAKRMQGSTERCCIARARDFFITHRELRLGPFELRGCRNVEQMEQVLSAHRRLAGGDLVSFYSTGTNILHLAEYCVGARRGMWEAIGGATLYLSYGEQELLHVAGYLHWRTLLPETTIVTIQGERGRQQMQQRAREALGIHPANLLLLLYLQIGRVFGHRMARIRSRPSEEYNVAAQDSALYRIPRNYFRVRTVPASELYELSANQRDAILYRFARKHALLAHAFNALTEWLG